MQSRAPEPFGKFCIRHSGRFKDTVPTSAEMISPIQELNRFLSSSSAKSSDLLIMNVDPSPDALEGRQPAGIRQILPSFREGFRA